MIMSAADGAAFLDELARKRAEQKKRADEGIERRAEREAEKNAPRSMEDFYAYLPDHKYIYRPTREMWFPASVNACMPQVLVGASALKANQWLDQNRAVDQLTWMPDRPEVIEGAVIDQGGVVEREGVRVYNLYRAPAVISGDARAAGKWRDHLRHVYPEEADHIEMWLAQRIQKPGTKINHALVLAGDQGIGKDTILEPVKHGVGPWNWSEISATAMMGRFSGWAKAVVVRISEVRDLGDIDRYAFYEHTKVFAAAPPDVLRVDEKHIREHYVPNVLGLIMTTNYAVTGIYLPPDDRRHFVAASRISRDAFSESYFADFYGWYECGGLGHVVAYLRGLNIAAFNPKTPPPKTTAWQAMVQANAAPEESELAELLEEMGSPAAVTIAQLRESADLRHMYGIKDFLAGAATRRQIPHRMAECGYDIVPNDAAKDGRWVVGHRRETVYARRLLSRRDQIIAARALSDA
jgi:hypothetical protein